MSWTESMRATMRRTKTAGTVLALALGALGAGEAKASPAEEYGLFGRGVATAGTQTAAADDAGAAYYNPAGLAIGGQANKTSVQLGYATGLPFFGINRQKGDPKTLERFPSQLPEWQGWANLGAVFPMGGKLQDKATLGLVLALPQDKLVKVQMFDPRYPQWLRYSTNNDRMVLALSMGVKLSDKVAIGFGANVLAGLEGTVDFGIDLFNRRVEKRDLNFALRPAVAPILGLTVTPSDTVRLAISYRGALQLNLKQPNKIEMGDLGTLLLDIQGVVHYTPHEIAIGAQIEPIARLRLSADLKASLWQFAPYPAVSVKVDLEGDIPKGLGLDQVLGFQTKDPKPGFQATLTPSVGAEYTFPDRVTRMRAGYAFRPSYVPDQTGPASNFLDNTAHLLGVGFTFQFMDPTEVFTQPLKFDIGTQLQVMQRRVVEKSTEDVVGPYDFGGVVIAAAGALRYEF